MTTSVAENLMELNKKISASCERVGRDIKDINIIAVTKYVSINRAKEACDSGIFHLGENYEEGILNKHQELNNKVNWHFIGSLQTRKVKNIIDIVDYIHSLDRLSLAKEINKRASKEVKCFIQVNVSGEASKHGISPDELVSFIKMLEEFSFIKIVGLMTMAPFTDDKAVIRACFRKLKELQNNVQALSLPFAPCQELSMGMSNDFEIAVEEGATFLRIGTSLVGKEF